MIQRIQTLYLLAAAALIGSMLLLPLARFKTVTETFTLHAFGIEDAAGAAVQPTAYLGVLLSIAFVLIVVDIFCYKRRMLQLRLGAAAVVLVLGGGIMLGLHYFLCLKFFAGLSIIGQQFCYPILFPLLALFLLWMAIRAIFRDEILVRSLDRIR